MTTSNIAYSADTAISATAWESLAADDWASSADVDNTSNLYVDMSVGGVIAASATTIAAGESFDIYVAARYDKDITTSYQGGVDAAFGAADSTLTEDTEFTPLNLIFLTSVSVEATAPDTTQDYNWFVGSIAQAFGGIMPQHFMLVLHNNTGSAMTTGNVINSVGITYTSA